MRGSPDRSTERWRRRLSRNRGGSYLRAYTRKAKPAQTSPAALRRRSIFLGLTYELHRIRIFVYATRATPADRCRVGNPDRPMEPRTDHGPRSSRDYRHAQADAIHHRAQDAADHGRERAGAAERETAGPHL